MIAAIALTLYTSALVAAFGVRSWVQWHRTGDTGLRLDAGPVGTLRWWAKIAFLLAILLGFAGPIAALLGLSALSVLDHPSVAIAGSVLAVIGIVMTLLAQFAMGTSWRIGVDDSEDTALVTGGPFAVARNPIFTAMAITSAGLTLMVPNLPAIIGFIALISALQLQVRRVEEPYLLRTHGSRYRHYAARVGRFLPHLGRLRFADPAGE